MSSPLYKLLLAAHLTVSGGWLGLVAAKLVLALAALTSATPAALYLSVGVLDVAFPPVAVGTAVTGVLLSLGTKWGLLQHTWVATKIALSVGVVTTAVLIGDRFVQGSLYGLPGQLVNEGTPLGVTSAPAFLLTLSAAHVLMLGIATVVSVYKPWGRTPFGRHKAVKP